MQTPSHLVAPCHSWLIPALLALFALTGCAFAPSVLPVVPTPSQIAGNLTQAESDELEHSQKFAQWVADFSVFARAAGIDEATLHIAFDDVRFVPRSVELDRTQPEFTRTVWSYLDNALSPQRIVRGQDKLSQLRPQIDAIARVALRNSGRSPCRDLGHGEQLRQ